MSYVSLSPQKAKPEAEVYEFALYSKVCKPREVIVRERE